MCSLGCDKLPQVIPRYLGKGGHTSVSTPPLALGIVIE
jgi:hypothetical protein